MIRRSLLLLLVCQLLFVLSGCARTGQYEKSARHLEFEKYLGTLPMCPPMKRYVPTEPLKVNYNNIELYLRTGGYRGAGDKYVPAQILDGALTILKNKGYAVLSARELSKEECNDIPKCHNKEQTMILFEYKVLFERLLRDSPNASSVEATILLVSMVPNETYMYLYDIQNRAIALIGTIHERRRSVSHIIPGGYRWAIANPPKNEIFEDYNASVTRGIDKMLSVLPNVNGSIYAAKREQQYIENYYYRIVSQNGRDVVVTESKDHNEEKPSYYTY